MPSAEDCATLQALFEGVDGARAEAEAEWGCERLPRLIGDDLRAKFNRQKLRWSSLLQAAWDTDRLSGPQLEELKATAASMQRAWKAIAASASEAGHRPILPDVWEVVLADGSVAAFVRTNDDAAKVIADGRYLSVYTPAEVAAIIDALPPALQMAKTVFPGAKVGTPTDRSWVANGDEIPFGDAA